MVAENNKKIGFFSDLHIGLHQNSEKWHDVTFEWAKWFTHELKKQKITKRERTLDYVGCSFEDLKNHLEKQFQPGMSWENRVEWHIDHIVPVNYFIKNFDFTDINVQKKCFHYTNLRPLWKSDNLSKGSKIISGDITSPKM